MKPVIAISLSCLCAGAAFAAEDGRWITFKTGRNSQGAVLHQIDRNSIRQEGAYKSFWTRVWLVQERQPLAFTQNESIVFLSEKFAVDCMLRRFGTRFIDSNQPAEMAQKAKTETMRWDGMGTIPAVGRAVCGDK
jgi:hypothetical protein